jgi:hypothetical protein
VAADWRNKVGLGGFNGDLVRFLRGGGRWKWDASSVYLALPARLRDKYRKLRNEDPAVKYIAQAQEILHSFQEVDSYGEGAVDDEKLFDAENSRQIGDAATDPEASLSATCRNTRENLPAVSYKQDGSTLYGRGFTLRCFGHQDEKEGIRCMSDMTFWEPTMGAMEAIVDCLPRETQQYIVERLQILTRVQETRGLTTASYFSRALSGEPSPAPKPKTKLVVIK